MEDVAIEPVRHRGKAKLGARVRPGWFVQTHEHPELVGRTLVEILHRGDGRPDGRTGMGREQAARVLDRYELAHAAEQRFESLSGGQQARFQILLLELSGATLLLLDEPTDNLDVQSAEALEDGLESFERHGRRRDPRPLVRPRLRPVPGLRRRRRGLRVRRAGLGRGPGACGAGERLEVVAVEATSARFEEWHATYAEATRASQGEHATVWQLEELRVTLGRRSEQRFGSAWPGSWRAAWSRPAGCRAPWSTTATPRRSTSRWRRPPRGHGYAAALLERLEAAAREQGRTRVLSEIAWAVEDVDGPASPDLAGRARTASRSGWSTSSDDWRCRWTGRCWTPWPRRRPSATATTRCARPRPGARRRGRGLGGAGRHPDDRGADGRHRARAGVARRHHAPRARGGRRRPGPVDGATPRRSTPTGGWSPTPTSASRSTSPSGPTSGAPWSPRRHRGHRLGLAVKVANLRLLQARHPHDRPRCVTFNAEVNAT